MRTADHFLHILHVKGKHSKKILKAIGEKFTSRLPPKYLPKVFPNNMTDILIICQKAVFELS
jgi:hypothetical protein